MAGPTLKLESEAYIWETFYCNFIHCYPFWPKTAKSKSQGNIISYNYWNDFDIVYDGLHKLCKTL